MLPLSRQTRGGDREFNDFCDQLSPLIQEDPVSSFSPITGNDASPPELSFPDLINLIEDSIERQMRMYCNRASVAKRFQEIYFSSLDFKALAKQISEDTHSLSLIKEREELSSLLLFAQNTKNHQSLFDSLLRELIDKTE